MDIFKRLNDINQRIWNFGFSQENLTDLDIIAEDIRNGRAVFERIPQAQQSGLSKGSKILCAASVICRGCPRTESETREIYDTEDLQGEGLIQEILVEQWARRTGCWFEQPEDFLMNICQLQDNGTESAVFFDAYNYAVYKLISLKHYNVLRLALDRVAIHNGLFPETAMKVLGFARDKSGQFVIMVLQPYVIGDVITETERKEFMSAMGFKSAGMDYGMHLNYYTPELYVGDLNEYNVIKGSDGLHVIDADCRVNVQTLGCGGNFVIPAPILDFSNPYYKL